MSVVDLPTRHAAGWDRATRHPFLAAVAAGTVPEAAFRTWLVQDYLFVGDLLRFQSRLLARAPRAAQAILVAGAAALVDELAWFEKVAVEEGLDLSATRLPATAAYDRLLTGLDGVPVPEALTALWALERVYLDAWSFAAPGAEPYRDFVAHWTTPEFAAYVTELATVADEALAGADRGAAEPHFVAVVEAEIAFWDMAWEPAS
ncbi:aminopyrimidine aminohydrolase [Virgisporangium aliadipatigenens]|uniref:Aminopyrimidine aminohydrolase n=1 Tax=Virgisporangium aliadipatigenens TaxID=741659 RepID=A0A8J3YEK3_9ACTN|nr:TenA family transcriptional regulator [Virgisporangium aliadipatigenens]GIJ43709.1 aminopyrimidine aminohydrolase [Virgisporangium aliadipatigenens]